MTRVDRGVGLVVAFAVTLAIAWVSNVAMAPPRSGDALLRLSWSARPERVETCQTQSAEAQAKLPAHMRQAIICEGASAEYRLELLRNGARIADDTVRGGGLRHDRPLYVFREFPQPVGDADITVRVSRVGPASAAPGSAPAAAAGQIPDLPQSLVFNQRLHFEPGRVILVTYDAERRELVELGRMSR